MEVEVVYALPGGADTVRVSLPAGATAADAVRASGLLERHPEIGLRELRLGVYGKAVGPQAALGNGDRVEIYRPLAVDPKEARRQRAREKALRKR
jgi:putative ubiquitin-RnfH superfamily antitoxin RatB of RatAB toxin-antitoxin module